MRVEFFRFLNSISQITLSTTENIVRASEAERNAKKNYKKIHLVILTSMFSNIQTLHEKVNMNNNKDPN